jgi:hypothetical protein
MSKQYLPTTQTCDQPCLPTVICVPSRDMFESAKTLAMAAESDAIRSVQVRQAGQRDQGDALSRQAAASLVGRFASILSF